MDDVTLANMAVSHLGAETIGSLDEASVEAINCKLFYKTARDATLEALDWNFARRRSTLALLGEEPPDNWSFGYAYPSDCLKFRRIQHPSRNPRFPYKFEVGLNAAAVSKAIFCDVQNAKGVYTKRITDEDLFSSAFNIAFSFKLAELTAMPITRKPQMMQSMAQQFALKISEAEANDQNESEPDEEPESAFVKARK